MQNHLKRNWLKFTQISQTLACEPFENIKARQAMQHVPRPIYHYHIRKTAGTSINYAFFSHSGYHDLSAFYRRLSRKYNHRLIAREKVFVGWNKRLLKQGNYFYGFSHIPAHKLRLPDGAYTFTTFRDPLKRLTSHYNMLRKLKARPKNPVYIQEEFQWLGHSFADFAAQVPKQHLLNQLYMFSKDYSVAEAFDRLSQVNQILYSENLQEGLDALAADLELDLPEFHQNISPKQQDIPQDEIDKALGLLAPEYELLDKLKQTR